MFVHIEVGDAMDLFGMSAQDWAPIFLSVLAISFTLLQAKWQRRHDRLTVRPKLIFECHAYRGDIVNGNAKIKVTVENIGQGPAIIESFGLFDGLKKIEPKKNVFVECTDRPAMKLSEKDLIKGNGIKAGELREIHVVDISETDIEELASFLDHLGKYLYEIKYTSVYEDESWIAKEDCSYFLRFAAEMRQLGF